MKRAISSYVRTGLGGSQNAVKRMGAARGGAINALRVFRDLLHDGAKKTLENLNLGNLVGASAEKIYLRLIDFIPGIGGRFDQGVTRNAWASACAELSQDHSDINIDQITAEQMRSMFESFLSNAIEGIIMGDIGVNALKMLPDEKKIDALHKELNSYIRRSVSDAIADRLEPDSMASFSDEDIRNIVDDICLQTWELMEEWQEQE